MSPGTETAREMGNKRNKMERKRPWQRYGPAEVRYWLHCLETGEGVGVSTDVIYVHIHFTHIARSVSNLLYAVGVY